MVDELKESDPFANIAPDHITPIPPEAYGDKAVTTIETKPLTPGQQEQQRLREVRERSEGMIHDLDGQNRESLRTGHERLGYRVGLGEHEVFILSQPVDVQGPSYNEARKETDSLTYRHYIMVTKEGIRAIVINKGELAPDGQTSMDVARKTAVQKSPRLQYAVGDPAYRYDPDNPETYQEHDVVQHDEHGKDIWIKVPGEEGKTDDNRYQYGEKGLLISLQMGVEKWENGHGELRYYQKTPGKRDVSGFEAPTISLVDENVSSEEGGDVAMRDLMYDSDLHGFNHDKSGFESFHIAGFQAVNNRERFAVSRLVADADIPDGVVGQAFENSKQHAQKERVFSKTSGQKQLDMLGALARQMGNQKTAA